MGRLGLVAADGSDPEISGICSVARDARDGYLFAALSGARAHGASFVGEALEGGAAAVLTDREGAEIASTRVAESGAALVVADDARRELAKAAALWFGAQPDTVVAVTGTNGKTSVAAFLRQIWSESGRAAVNLGTTGVEGAWSAPLERTTPDPLELHRVLAEAEAAGVTHVAMEASSHGLDQRRLDGVRLKAAGFTNLTRDHLDYHAGMEDYFAAKAGLFERVLPASGTAVVDISASWGGRMRDVALARGQTVLTVGGEGADLQALGRRRDGRGQELEFAWKGSRQVARLDLVGDFQADNALHACALAIAAGEDPEAAFEALPRLRAVRGRMELAATRANGAPVFVDYAHTPDAVAKALAALRPHVFGRLVAILGAGGDRDAEKRPLMGAAAARGADIVIVSDDNPRSEDPAAIRSEVLRGAREAAHEAARAAGTAATSEDAATGGGRVVGGIREIGDRAEAILMGVDMLGRGDALLIAGKGHERGQEVGDSVLPFDDVEQASMAVRALEGGRA